MNQQFLKPKTGLKVRDPKGGHLPEDGAAVPVSPYWNRRLKDGDVVKATKPKSTNVVAANKTKPAKKES